MHPLHVAHAFLQLDNHYGSTSCYCRTIVFAQCYIHRKLHSYFKQHHYDFFSLLHHQYKLQYWFFIDHAPHAISQLHYHILHSVLQLHQDLMSCYLFVWVIPNNNNSINQSCFSATSLLSWVIIIIIIVSTLQHTLCCEYSICI